MGLVLAGVVTGCQSSESMSSMEVTDAMSEVDEARTLFGGTWKLVRVERYDQRGELLQDFVHQEIGRPGALGYLMYDGERMAAVVQQDKRARSASAVLTPEEALAAVESYTAYFGFYSIDTEDGYVVNQVLGSLNPRGAGGDTQPFYELVEDELVLTPSLQCPDSFLTDRGCGYGTTGIQLRNVWEKVESTTAGDIDTRFLGFWQIDRVERRTSDGREVLTPQYEQGYLIYMPSGHMMVHLMRPDRAFYEGARPTSTEAAAAMQGYGSYVGSFTVDGNAAVVLHRRDGHLNPNRVGDEAFRSFEFRNDQLILKPPVSNVDGQELQTVVYWNRLSLFGSS
tara:strand:- start:1587 stop:2603 length:1017 start_codon:yes stop_codon:yes gene_type:complete